MVLAWIPWTAETEYPVPQVELLTCLKLLFVFSIEGSKIPARGIEFAGQKPQRT